MIKIEYDADIKNKCKNPKCNVETKDTNTFEAEYLMAIIYDIILSNDKSMKKDTLWKEVQDIQKEFKNNRDKKKEEK